MSWNKQTAANTWRLPPCGGSGLKYSGFPLTATDTTSPSMRREWIEMSGLRLDIQSEDVSLHAEGVD